MTEQHTAAPATDAPAEYALADAAHTVEFTGRHLAEVSTETSRQPRWTTMDLYQVHESQTGVAYVLHIEGHSVLAHAHGSSCNAGVETALSDALADGAEPCHRCLPRGFGSLDLVDFEITHSRVVPCTDAAAVVTALYTTTDGVRTLSRPAQRLLAAAALEDTAFDPSSLRERL